jgi:adenine-specific DNA-methyltransferase
MNDIKVFSVKRDFDDQSDYNYRGKKLRINSKFNTNNIATIFNGDCLEFLKKIPDNSIQLIITSPPYNIGKEYESKLDIKSYRNQQEKVINECVRILKENGSICWEVGNSINQGEIIPLDILLYDIFKKKNMKLRNRIIWHFGHGLHATRRYSGRYETVNWYTKSDDYIFNLDNIRIPQKYPGKKHYRGPNTGKYSGNPKGKNPSDVWDIPNVKCNHVEKTSHPCQFPISLVQRLVLSLSNKNDFVLDPFLGVGSTAIAGIINHRKVAGAELHNKYYEISKERIRKAYYGELKFRPDIPTYVPPKQSKLTINPFN